MSSHIHPLLQAEEEDQGGTVGGANGGGNVLNRIDADKLHGALTNASMLGTLEVGSRRWSVCVCARSFKSQRIMLHFMLESRNYNSE